MEFLYRYSGSSRWNDGSRMLRIQAQRTAALGILVGIMIVTQRE